MHCNGSFWGLVTSKSITLKMAGNGWKEIIWEIESHQKSVTSKNFHSNWSLKWPILPNDRLWNWLFLLSTPFWMWSLSQVSNPRSYSLRRNLINIYFLSSKCRIRIQKLCSRTFSCSSWRNDENKFFWNSWYDESILPDDSRKWPNRECEFDSGDGRATWIRSDLRKSSLWDFAFSKYIVRNEQPWKSCASIYKWL